MDVKINLAGKNHSVRLTNHIIIFSGGPLFIDWPILFLIDFSKLYMVPARQENAMHILHSNMNLFPMVIRNRGLQYCGNDRVSIDYADDLSVMASVRGTDVYQVSISWQNGFLCVACTCPQGENHYCKHIYAVLLTMENNNLLPSFQKIPNIRLKLVPQDALFQDDVDDVHPGKKPSASRKRKMPAQWDICLNNIHGAFMHSPVSRDQQIQPDAAREIVYAIRQASGYSAPSYVCDLSVSIFTRSRKKNGDWGSIKSTCISNIALSQCSKEDAKIISVLSGARSIYDYGRSYYGISNLMISQPMAEVVLPAMSATGRLYYQNDHAETMLGPLLWQEEEVWAPVLKMIPDAANENYLFTVELNCSEKTIPVTEPVLITHQRILIIGKHICRLDDLGAYPWIEHLRQHGRLEILKSQVFDFINKLYSIPYLPPLSFPEEVRISEVASEIKIRLTLKTQQSFYYLQDKRKFRASLHFLYAGLPVAAFPRTRGFYSANISSYLLRNGQAEEDAIQTLHELGFKTLRDASDDATHEIASRQFSHVVTILTAKGWQIEADGKLYREAGAFTLNVTTGIDWFELHGECEFENQKAKLPALLRALQKKESLIELSDGTFGVIPEEVLKKYAFLAGMGEMGEGHVRFKRSQAGLLDALLAAQPEATCDALFENTRQQLQNFCGIKPSSASDSFQGVLRRYQEEGLGWFEFLRKFGYGGCLADDMGLGKTVQVLAMLEKRRLLKLFETLQEENPQEKKKEESCHPSLVVAPRSIIFNWQKEAARFTPGLNVLDHTGMSRKTDDQHFEKYDLILTTYGTLRRDITFFRNIPFDYVILDEAQAVKNADTVTAKAVRLLCASHRLALSGTPIENHLSELWSLFEFLNPGLLGAASVFKRMSADANASSPETRALLSQALKPFILRRTKALVAPELPQKTEQVVYCEMDKTQARLYNELRDHYRLNLLKKLDEDGMGKSKMHILEALLRLRQAACHPGLLDPKWQTGASAKTEFLLPQLAEILEEGHKALVFSQFTSFLAIVKKQLDGIGQRYLYLDGKTKNREQLVQVFQEEESEKLFLISLRAGGLGLNLTAAEYVYLLDPWWNPAVEAQAIDRSHRIGQTSQVFAYRLITRNTVEERVLELQQSKRDLFSALIQEDTGLLRSLNREDLEILLS